MTDWELWQAEIDAWLLAVIHERNNRRRLLRTIDGTFRKDTP